MKIQLNRVIYCQCFSLQNIRIRTTPYICTSCNHSFVRTFTCFYSHSSPFLLLLLVAVAVVVCVVIQTSYAYLIHTTELCMKSLMRAPSYTLAQCFTSADANSENKRKLRFIFNLEWDSCMRPLFIFAR